MIGDDLLLKRSLLILMTLLLFTSFLGCNQTTTEDLPDAGIIQNYRLENMTLSWDKIEDAVFYTFEFYDEEYEYIEFQPVPLFSLVPKYDFSIFNTSVNYQLKIVVHYSDKTTETSDYIPLFTAGYCPPITSMSIGYLKDNLTFVSHYDGFDEAVNYTLEINGTEYTTTEYIFDITGFDTDYLKVRVKLNFLEESSEFSEYYYLPIHIYGEAIYADYDYDADEELVIDLGDDEDVIVISDSKNIYNRFIYEDEGLYTINDDGDIVISQNYLDMFYTDQTGALLTLLTVFTETHVHMVYIRVNPLF